MNNRHNAVSVAEVAPEPLPPVLNSAGLRRTAPRPAANAGQFTRLRTGPRLFQLSDQGFRLFRVY